MPARSVVVRGLASVTGMPSFDVVSEVDRQEVRNALDQAEREIANRFDFKNTDSSIEQNELAFTLRSVSEDRLAALRVVLEEKLVKRGVSLKGLDYGKVEEATQNTVRQVATLKVGISADKAREINKLIKADGPKGVSSQTQGDTVRVTAKKRDDLQAVIALLKGADLGDPAAVQQLPRLTRRPPAIGRRSIRVRRAGRSGARPARRRQRSCGAGASSGPGSHVTSWTRVSDRRVAVPCDSSGDAPTQVVRCTSTMSASGAVAVSNTPTTQVTPLRSIGRYESARTSVPSWSTVSGGRRMPHTSDQSSLPSATGSARLFSPTCSAPASAGRGASSRMRGECRRQVGAEGGRVGIDAGGVEQRAAEHVGWRATRTRSAAGTPSVGLPAGDR